MKARSSATSKSVLSLNKNLEEIILSKGAGAFRTPNHGKRLSSPKSVENRYTAETINLKTLESEEGILSSRKTLKSNDECLITDYTLGKSQLNQAIDQRMRTEEKANYQKVALTNYLKMSNESEDGLNKDKDRVRKLTDKLESKTEERRKNLSQLYEQLKSSTRGLSKMSSSHRTSERAESRNTNIPTNTDFEEIPAVQELRRTVEELSQQLADLTQENTRLQQEIEAGGIRESQLKTASETYRKMIEELEGQVETLLKNRDDDTEHQILEIEQEFENFKLDHDKVQQELSSKKQEVEELQRKLRLLDAQFNALNRTLQTTDQELKESRATLDMMASVFERKEASMKEKITMLTEQLEKGLSAAGISETALSNEVNLLQQKVERLELENTRLKDIENKFKKTVIELESTQQKTSELISQRDFQEKRLSSCNQTIEELKKQMLNESQKLTREIEAEKQVAETYLIELENLNKRYKSAVEQHEKEIALIKGNLDDALSKTSEAEKLKTQRFSELEGKLIEKENLLQSVKFQHESELEKLKGVIQGLQNDLMKMNKENEILKEKCESIHLNSVDPKEYSRLLEERENLKNDMQKLAVVNAEKEKLLEERTNESRTSLDRIKNLESALENARVQFRNQEEQIINIQNEIIKKEQLQAQKIKEATQKLLLENAELGDKLHNQETELQTQKSLINALEEGKKQLEQKLKETQEKLQIMKIESEKNNSADKKYTVNDIDSLTQQLKFVTEQYELVKSQNETLALQIKTLQDTTVKQEDLFSLRELQGLKISNAKLSMQLDQAQRELKNTLETKNKESMALNERIKTLELELAESAAGSKDNNDQQLASKYASEINTLTAEKTNLQKLLSRNEKKYAEEISALTKEIQSLKTALAIAENNFKLQIEEKQGKHESETSKLKAIIEQNQLLQESSQQEVESLRSQNEQLNRQVQELTLLNSSLIEKNKHISEQVKEKEEQWSSKIKEIEVQLANITQEKEELSNKLNEYEEKMKSHSDHEGYETPRLTLDLPRKFTMVELSKQQSQPKNTDKSDMSAEALLQAQIRDLQAQNEQLQESLRVAILKQDDRVVAIKKEFDTVMSFHRSRQAKFEEYICANILELLKEASKTRKVKTFAPKEMEDARNLIPEIKRVFLECLEASSPTTKKKKGDNAEIQLKQQIAQLKEQNDNLHLDINKLEEELRLYEQEQIKIEEIFKHAKKTRTVLMPINRGQLVEVLEDNPNMRPLAKENEFVKNALLYHAFLNEVVFSLPDVKYPEPKNATGAQQDEKSNESAKTIESLKKQLEESEKEKRKNSKSWSSVFTKLDKKILSLLEKAGYGEEYNSILRGDMIKDESPSTVSFAEKVGFKLEVMEKMIEEFRSLKQAHEKWNFFPPSLDCEFFHRLTEEYKVIEKSYEVIKRSLAKKAAGSRMGSDREQDSPQKSTHSEMQRKECDDVIEVQSIVLEKKITASKPGIVMSPQGQFGIDIPNDHHDNEKKGTCIIVFYCLITLEKKRNYP